MGALYLQSTLCLSTNKEGMLSRYRGTAVQSAFMWGCYLCIYARRQVLSLYYTLESTKIPPFKTSQSYSPLPRPVAMIGNRIFLSLYILVYTLESESPYLLLPHLPITLPPPA